MARTAAVAVFFAAALACFAPPSRAEDAASAADRAAQPERSTEFETAPPRCVAPELAALALDVDMVSSRMAAICAPRAYVVELRNRSSAALSDVALTLAPPLGPGRMRFEGLDAPTPGGAVFFEVSRDDGETWSPVAAPTGDGSLNAPFRWTSEATPALAQLAPSGRRGDSVMLRWRARLGEAYADSYAFDPELHLGASATDACGARLAATPRILELAALRPSLTSVLEGRNATRGGAFGPVAYAAPGDVVQWRVTLGNVGEAAAPAAEVEFEARRRLGPAPNDADPATPLSLADFAAADGEAPLSGAFARFAATPPGGRSTRLFEERVGAACARRDLAAHPAWSCGDPALSLGGGAGGATQSPAWASAFALLDTAPDPNAIAVEQSVRGVDGQRAPGDAARVELTIRNDGAPAFSPSLDVELPDGYAFDDAAEPAARDAAGRSWRPEVVVADRSRATLILGGAEAALETGREVAVSFQIRRVAPALLEADDLISTLRYVDGCGDAFAARAARTPMTPRRAALTAELSFEGGPMVTAATRRKRLAIAVANSGDEAAPNLSVDLSLGAGWAGLVGEGCAAAPSAAGRRRYVCRAAESLEPGQRALVEATLEADAIWFEGPPDRSAADAALDVEARVSARARPEAAGEETATAQARAAALGFALTQRLLTDAGAPRPPGAPLNLGERATLEVSALWFGRPLRGLARASIAQTPPPSLRRLDASAPGAPLEGEVAPRLDGSFTPPARGATVWSLSVDASTATAARFVGWLGVEAVGSAVAGTAQSATTAEAAATVDASAVLASAAFELDGRTFGVDAAERAELAAAPLPAPVAEPEIALSLTLDAAKTGADGRAHVSPDGETTAAQMAIRNVGRGPAYLDWAALEAPRGLEFVDPARDGLDNDGDGDVDEPDEASIAAIERRADGGARARWIASPSAGGAVGASAQRLAPGEGASWRIGLRASADAPPGAIFDVALSGQFGALPFAQTGETARVRAAGVALVGRPPIAGFVTLIDASEGGPMTEAVRHGERVAFRARVAPPPGRVEELVVELPLPDALDAVAPSIARLGPALECPGAEPPTVAPAAGERPRRLEWRLGACVVRAGADSDRGALLDFSAEIIDAPADAPSAQRAAWRAITLEAAATYDGWAAAGLERARRRDVVGAAALKLRGAAVAARLVAAEPAPGGRADAGDAPRLSLEIENVGDQPAFELRVLARPALGAEATLDCGAIALAAADGAGRAALDREGCEAQLDLSAAPLAPGERRRVDAAYLLAPSAQLGAPAGLALTFEARSARPLDGRYALTIDRPTPPRLRVETALGGGDGPPAAAFGERLRLVASAAAPEGALNGSFEILLKAPAAAVEALTTRLLLEGEGGERLLGGPPARLDRLADGWVRIRRELVDLAVGPVGATPRRRRLELIAEFALGHDAALSDGDVVTAAARIRLNGEDASAAPLASQPAPAFRIAEPTLAAAALIETDRPGGGIGAGVGEETRFVGRLCNRGGAPAYGLRLAARLPRGFAELAPTRLLRADAQAEPAGGAAFGRVEQIDGRLVAAAFEGAALDPGDCVELVARAALRLAPELPAAARRPATLEGGGRGAAPGAIDAARDGDIETASVGDDMFEVAAQSARSGREASRPGRIYRDAAFASARLRREFLQLEGPRQAAARAGEAVTLPFAVSAPALGLGATLFAEASGAGLDWTLFEDRDGDGALGPADALWRDGRRMEPGERVRLVAQARAPAAMTPAWRGAARIRARIAAADVTARAERAVALTPNVAGAPPPAAGVALRRLLALDRNCDGALDDETAQDAAFEAAKAAAPGECLAVRVVYRNLGAEAVGGFAVEEAPPAGLAPRRDSIAFESTPPGLIAAGAVESDGRLRYGFVGALAPGRVGYVRYHADVKG